MVFVRSGGPGVESKDVQAHVSTAKDPGSSGLSEIML